MPLPDTPEGIVEELRREALILGLELEMSESEIAALTFNEAADLIKHYEKALREIAAGHEPAREIALKALDWFARLDSAMKKD